MVVIGIMIFILLFVFFQALLFETQNKSKHDVMTGNGTLEDFISDSLLESWLSDSPKSTAWRALPTAAQPPSEGTPTNQKGVHSSSNQTFGNAVLSSTPLDLQSDDSSVTTSPSRDSFVNSLFKPPKQNIMGDWSVVLGTFQHYDDENWKDFLIKTEVPFIVRMFLSDSSETVTISRTFTKKKNINQGKKLPSPKMALTPVESSDFEMTIETASWLLTHVSKFRLGKSFIEHDLDGTDSKNTFFFSSPRLLIHNKLKDKWRTAIVRHFDANGLNMFVMQPLRKGMRYFGQNLYIRCSKKGKFERELLDNFKEIFRKFSIGIKGTFVDRDRRLTARRFFKRIL